LDGTEKFLVDFRFPSNGWQGSNSFVDNKTGKIWLYQAEGEVCPIGGGSCRAMTEEEKGFVVYDPATNTIEIGVKNGWGEGYQKTFNSVLKIDDLIKNDTNTTGNDISVIGSNELVDEDSTVLIANSTDTDGDAITVIGSNEVVAANGNTLISEEENGEIHIGENSLVTVEKDGVQLLYATDANGDQIDINIKAGTDLLVDGKSVTQALTDIDTNKTNIATNTAGIATNKTNIATNKTNIATNTAGIATNKTNIATNTAGIATNKTNIATNTAGIATNKTNIATNTTNIATNATGIANNVVRLDNLAALAASNTSRIEGLETLTGLMQNEYRSGIASSIALSQIQYAASGFSIGVGHGEFKNKDEMAVGIGYGGQFNEDVGFQFQFGTSGDSTGFGFTVNF
jgi:hypothetical protein